MNILFLTLLDFESIEEHNIYTDLLRKFPQYGHNIYAISPIERRKKQNTHLIKENDVTILKLKIGNTQKTNIIEKGISTVTIESLFLHGIKKSFSNIKFDLILYSTPPITFCKTVEYVKKRDGAKTYLLLKDIFPQNAVDLGMMNKAGIKGFIYRFFRKKEKKLYSISDYIGCMSDANVEYIIKHNSEVNPEIVEVCPNSIEVIDKSISKEIRTNVRKKYNIPLDKIVYVYGGNLGKPQGIDFLIKCLESQKKNKEVFFLIVGDGTEYDRLETFVDTRVQDNLKLMKHLPKGDYDLLVAACDVGMIFLDYRFTIPNFPSRILSYMQAKMPVLIASDLITDIGKIAEENYFGYWMESNDISGFSDAVNYFNSEKIRKDMGYKAYDFLLNRYTVEETYRIIMKHFTKI